MQYYEAMAEAVRIANQVLAGELDPNHGCSMIAGIGEDLDYPEALSAFFLLSHEQYDHEHLGTFWMRAASWSLRGSSPVLGRRPPP
jgi:hypothetical protein